MKLWKDKEKKMKKWQKNLIWFVWCFFLVVAFDITDYFIAHNMLGTFNVLLVEMMFLGLGASSVILEYKFRDVKKGRKK